MTRVIKILAIALALVSALAATTLLAQTKGGVVRGRVVDEGDRPVAGATVTASYQSYGGGARQYGGGYNRQAVTGPDGRYAIALNGLPPGEYAASATWRSTALIPETDANFASNAQTVRNFRHAIVERTAESEYGNGGMVVVMNAIMDFTDLNGAIVTAVSKTTGQTITRTVRQTGEGWTITGLPFGAYTVTVKLNGRPMQIKLWGVPHTHDPFGSSVSGTVTPNDKIFRAFVKP